MFTRALKQVKKRLSRSPRLASFFAVMETTPRYALHWYLLLTLGLIIVTVSVVLSWLSFSNVAAFEEGLENPSGTLTIDRDELQEVINMYTAKETEFSRLKQVPPVIADPGN